MVRQAHHERTIRQTVGAERAYESRGHMNSEDLRMQYRANHLESVGKTCLWREYSQLVARWAHSACAEKLS